MSLLLTNARSLCPKIDSLKDIFSSLVLNIACVAETWYEGGRGLREHVENVEGLSGIIILHKGREGRTKKIGEGVAIAFDVASCNLKIRNLKERRQSIKDSGHLCRLNPAEHDIR